MLSNLPVMIWMTIILASVLTVLPGTVIQYKITSGPAQSILLQEGITGFIDPLGMRAIPCDGLGFVAPFPRISSGFAIETFKAWQAGGKFLGYMILYFAIGFAIQYAAWKKMRPLKFFIAVVSYAGLMFLLFMVFSQSLPECNPDTQYEFVSFWPYWPAIVLMFVTIFLVARNYFLLNRLKKQETASS